MTDRLATDDDGDVEGGFLLQSFDCRLELFSFGRAFGIMLLFGEQSLAGATAAIRIWEGHIRLVGNIGYSESCHGSHIRGLPSLWDLTESSW